MPAITANDLKAKAASLVVEAESLLAMESQTEESKAQFETLFTEIKGLEEKAAKFERLEEARARMNQSTGRVVPELDPLTDENNNKTHMGKPHKYNLAQAIINKIEGRFDGLERECSDEIAKRSGRVPKGFYLPFSMPVQTRSALGIQSGTGAGATQEVILGLIEALRAKTLFDKLGCEVLSGLTGVQKFPVQTSRSSWFWVGEGGEVGDGTPAIAQQIQLSPKLIGNQAFVNRQFLVMTDISDAWVKKEIINGISRGLDHTLFQGSGLNNIPKGVFYLDNTNEVRFGSGPSGGPITWAGCVAMESSLAQAHALDLGDVSSYSYVGTPAVRGAGKTTTVIPNSQYSNFIWQNDQTINGYKAYATTQTAQNISLGEGTDQDDGLHSLMFGHWPSMMVGYWTGVDLVVDNVTAARSGQVILTAMLDADIQCRYPQAFAIASDISIS